jgi:hypothetical protein
MRKISLFAFFLITTRLLYGQGEIPVDMFTGNPSVQIGLWTVNDHDLTVPVGLSYNASGVRLSEQTSLLGIGWKLAASTSVNRVVWRNR